MTTFSYQYFLLAGYPVRVSLDEEGDPNYVESYDVKTNSYYRNNSILEDLYNHHESVEINEIDFYEKIENLSQK